MRRSSRLAVRLGILLESAVPGWEQTPVPETDVAWDESLQSPEIPSRGKLQRLAVYQS